MAQFAEQLQGIRRSTFVYPVLDSDRHPGRVGLHAELRRHGEPAMRGFFRIRWPAVPSPPTVLRGRARRDHSRSVEAVEKQLGLKLELRAAAAGAGRSTLPLGE